MSEHPCDWVICPECESGNAVLIDWRPDPDSTLKCPDCGARCSAEYHDECAEVVY